MCAEELQFPGPVQLDQPVQDEAPEQAGQDPDGQEEALAAGDPPCTVCGQTAARNDHMHMRMMHQRRSPSMKD